MLVRGASNDPFIGLESVLERVVWTSITPFGLTGPYRLFHATELTIAAMAGWVFQTGEPGRKPLRPGTLFLQACVPGVTAALATASAVFGRANADMGRRIDISCMEALLGVNRFHETTLSYTGMMARRVGSKVINTYPYTVYPCRDGYVGALTLTDVQWETLCQMIGLPELPEDLRFKTNRDRFLHADELDGYLMPWFKDRTAQECFEMGQGWRLPFAIVCDPQQILSLPQHQARGFLRPLPRQAGRPIVAPYAPFIMSATPWVVSKPAPRRGQDNARVYGSLGIAAQSLRELRREGVI